MRAVVVAGPRRLAVESVPDPKPEPGQAVVRVAACGICGSDLHVHQGGYLPVGSIMGHEFCGEVVEAAGGLVAGERVCVLPALSCGRCERCRSGLGMYCAEQRPLGLGQAPGAFAEYVAIAPHHAVRLPPGIDDEHGALVEPLAVALHAVDVARLAPGERCLVVGAGPIGLALALWAQHAGAREVIVSERSAGRRALADGIGATRVVDPAQGGLGDAVGPDGADVVFEAVGAPGLVQECIGHARFRGRVVVVGVCIGPDQFQPMTAVLKELELRFALAYERRDFERTVDRIERGALRPGALVTDRIGLDGVPAAFEALADPDRDCKVLVRP
jgi:(R,R)-butanediol dehydrogenase/meso-butanediol dehydrogenase/diacetyl reductase